MKIQKLAATLLNETRLIAFAGLLTLMAGSALAGGPDPDCIDLASECFVVNPDGTLRPTLANLCEATKDADSLKGRDRDGLISKVLAAGSKLAQGKTGDADQKLQNYEDKLDSLVNATKPKISEADANALSPKLIDAQMCVADLP